MPVKLRFTYEVPREAARELEAAVHKALAPLRSHGEWFKVSEIGATREIFTALRARGLERVMSPAELKAAYDRVVGYGRKRNYYKTAVRSRSALSAKAADRFA